MPWDQPKSIKKNQTHIKTYSKIIQNTHSESKKKTPKSITKSIKIHPKIDREKTWKMKPKGFQNGAEIDAKTNQNSADPLVGRARPR